VRTGFSLLRFRIPLLATASVTAAFGLMAAVPAAAQAATATSPSPITVTGQILQGSVGTRAVVNIVAQPPDAQTDHMVVGQSMSWTKVASGVSSPDGTFSLTFSPATLTPYANPDGTVSLLALAAVGHGFSAYGFVVNTRSPVSAVATPRMRLRKAASSTGFPAVGSFLAHPKAGTAIPAIGCTTPQLISIYSPQWGKVGQTSITITGDETQQFTYKSSQYTALGIAWAQYGWSESGTRSMASTSSVPFAKYGSNITYTYESEFRYGLYATGGCGNMTQVYDYWGGGKVITVNPVSATYCASYPAGSSPSFSTTTAAEFKAGIPVPQVGVTLTAQTGWDSTGYLTYGMGSHAHNVCGNAGPPGDHPGWLVVK
jgi:hypothetical protein